MRIMQNDVAEHRSLRIEDESAGFSESTHLYKNKVSVAWDSAYGCGDRDGWKIWIDTNQRLAFAFSADFSSHILMR